MRGECEENEGDEEEAVNSAPCTTTSDLTGLPVDGLMDVGEGTRHARNFFVHVSNDVFLSEMSLLHQWLVQRQLHHSHHIELLHMRRPICEQACIRATCQDMRDKIGLPVKYASITSLSCQPWSTSCHGVRAMACLRANA
jgi:hypothetical protein